MLSSFNSMSDKKELAEGKSLHEKRMDQKYSTAETAKEKLDSITDPELKKSFRSHAIIHMAALGWSKKEISEQLGISPGRVTAILSSQSAKNQVFKIQEELYLRDPQKMFMKILPKAVRTAEAVMSSKKSTQAVKSDTAFRFMDRALGKPSQKVEHEGNALRELFMALDRKNRGEEPNPKKDDAIDAEFKEVNSQVKEVSIKDPLDNWLDENL